MREENTAVVVMLADLCSEGVEKVDECIFPDYSLELAWEEREAMEGRCRDLGG